jgi:hypothetical protein
VQFDYLKSLEIEEKINKIRWCQTTNGARLLLSTNDKTIKLWKVQSCHVSAVYNRMISSVILRLSVCARYLISARYQCSGLPHLKLR